MSSPNGHTARDALAATPLPTKKDQWEAYKSVKRAAELEQAAADQAMRDERRLKMIRELAVELKYLTAGNCRERWKRIAEVVTKLNQLLGEKP